MAKSQKKNVKVRDLKPKKDAKGGGHPLSGTALGGTSMGGTSMGGTSLSGTGKSQGGTGKSLG